MQSNQSHKRAASAGALCVAAFLVCGGCGNGHDDLAADRVAEVNGHAVPRSAFKAARKTILSRAPKLVGSAAQTRELMATDLAMRQVISAEWIEQEAARQHLHITNDAVDTWYTKVEAAGDRARVSGGEASAYFHELHSVRGRRQARRTPARVDLLRQRLVARFDRSRAIPRVEIDRYYKKHIGIFRRPERRDLFLVLTARRSDALRALRDLKLGMGWKRIVRHYSLDGLAKQHHDWLVATTKTELEAPLRGAVYGASGGTVHGPLKTKAGWYIFKVVKIFPAFIAPIAQERDLISARIRDKRRDRTTTDFSNYLLRKYRPRTRCAEAVLAPVCSNWKPPREDSVL